MITNKDVNCNHMVLKNYFMPKDAQPPYQRTTNEQLDTPVINTPRLCAIALVPVKLESNTEPSLKILDPGLEEICSLT